MQAGSRLLYKGLAGRSVDEVKRWAQLGKYMLCIPCSYPPQWLTAKPEALTGDAIKYRFDPLVLVDFSRPETIKDTKLMSDRELGGKSISKIQHVPKTATEPAHARFHGRISTELPYDDESVLATGFAGWRNYDRPWTIFGKPLWDLEPFPYLALRVKSDGPKYFVNMQTETIVPTDIHQHRLHTRKNGEWETVYIQFRSFVRTNYGHVVEPQNEMMRHKTRSVGFSSIDRIPGPFSISIHKIWAALKMEEGDMLKDEDAT